MKRSPDLSKLLKLAKVTRSRIENLSKVEGGSSNLAGYCAVAARHLQLLADGENLRPVFVSGLFMGYNRILGTYGQICGHAWVEFEDYIVDITATQFKKVVTKIDRDFSKKIYLCKNSNPHYKKVYTGDAARKYARTWYCETLEEICEKADSL